MQVARTEACSGRHLSQHGLAHWLLTAHDRNAEDKLPLTQDLMVMTLGVHRASVTVAAVARHGWA